MKKTISTITAVILLVCCLTACGGNGSSNKLVGTWEGSIKVSENELKDTYLVFYDTGDWAYGVTQYNEKRDIASGTYTVLDKSTLKMVIDESMDSQGRAEATYTYNISGKKLTLETTGFGGRYKPYGEFTKVK